MTSARKITTLAIVTASLFASAGIATAQTPSSGMLLGIYAFENWRGLRVTSTIPGYSADGRLFPNDVLTQVADGSLVYSARRRAAFEAAKDQIGPNRWVALEVYRPNVGLIYFWVQFTPVSGGGPLAHSQSGPSGFPGGPGAGPGVGPGAGPGGPGVAPAAAAPMKAEIRTEQERGMSARSLFNGIKQQLNPGGGRSSNFGPNPGRRNGNSGVQIQGLPREIKNFLPNRANPGSLFGR
jgi:hypothetical protein